MSLCQNFKFALALWGEGVRRTGEGLINNKFSRTIVSVTNLTSYRLIDFFNLNPS